MALSDILKPRVVELGKIKIGGLGEARQKRDGGTFRLPRKDDHFTIVTLNRHNGELIPDDRLMESLKDEFADKDGKLRQIPIALLSNDEEDVMQTSYCRYQGKRLAAWSDGKVLRKFYDKGTWLQEPLEREFRPEDAEFKIDGKPYFKVHTVFNCVIAAAASTWGGVYKFRTTSRISADQLYSGLMHIKQLTGGFLRGMPLRMFLRPMQVSPEGATTTVYVVHIGAIAGDLQQLQSMAVQRAQFEVQNKKQLECAQLEYRKLLLPPGERESLEDQASIAEEFQPEDEGGDAPPAEIDPLAAELGLVPTATVVSKDPEPASQQTNGAAAHPAASKPAPATTQAKTTTVKETKEPKQPVASKASDAQIEDIQHEAGKIPPEEFDFILDSYGVAQVADLTRTQADELIGRLQAIGQG